MTARRSNVTAKATNLGDILLWRDMYRLEMGCQIVHDSIHARAGWTDEYMLFAAGTAAGYGSVAVGGPWKGSPTAYEFYVAPHERLRVFELFQALLGASGAVSIEVQSNDVLATTMLHTFARQVNSESILFHDQVRTCHRVPGAAFREPTAKEAGDVSKESACATRVDVSRQHDATRGTLHRGECCKEPASFRAGIS